MPTCFVPSDVSQLGNVKKAALLKIVHMKDRREKKTAEKTEYLHEFDEAVTRNGEITTLLNKTRVSFQLAEGMTSNTDKYIF